MQDVHSNESVTPGVVAESDEQTYDRNAQRGQNRSGIDLESDSSFDDFESGHPIEPARADEREADEGLEIRARVHERGHDVVAEED